jgi:hypothetical protein
MTDEEMAEAYENAQDYCGLLDVLFEEQYNQDYGGLSCYISPYIEQAYLAGLKAGRPEWHKVADGDLPKEEDLEMQVLCFTYDGYQLLTLFSDPKPIFKGYGVIAWCEIPKYAEE